MDVILIRRQQGLGLVLGYLPTYYKLLSTTNNRLTSLLLLSQNDAEKVVVVIMDKEHHPVERFVFEISQPPLLSIR